jgi:hypothetical protein
MVSDATSDHRSRTFLVSLDRLQRLEACEARVDLQARHIELLQKQIAETDAELKLERARGEKHAEALMRIARTSDERANEMKEQHAAALCMKDAVTAKVEAKLEEQAASHAAAITKLNEQHKAAVTKLKAENTALNAQAASTLKQLHAAVTTGAMEILPFRPSDKRQFVEWRVGGIPPLSQFDEAWCAAACAGGWKVELDAASGDTRAILTQGGPGFCTLRSAAPLPRVGASRQQLPTYRVVVEAYAFRQWCYVGFVPSHHAAAAVAPTPKYGIQHYGGWCIVVGARDVYDVAPDSGWTVIPPGTSAYATTDKVPPVPAGGAVEFAVDYASGTCRVAFYTPAAVAGGFSDAPHAKMELRFVATTGGTFFNEWPIPARSMLAAADSKVALYPAVATYNDSNYIWSFYAI